LAVGIATFATVVIAATTHSSALGPLKMKGLDDIIARLYDYQQKVKEEVK
jgi:hypothetical protein